MKFQNRFFYDDGAGEGGGDGQEGSAQANSSQGDQNNESSNTNTPPEIPADVQAELEELRKFKQSVENPPAQKTEEELAREAEREKAEMIKFGVERDLAKLDDFTKYESLKAKADRDLVFEEFAAQIKDENPDATPEEIEEAFNDEYKLNSENEKTKARGEARLKREAEAMRQPFEQTYTKVQEEFNNEKKIRDAVPKFNKFIDEQVSAISDKLVLFKAKDGEEEIPIEVELTAEEKAEIAKTFKNDKAFYDFTRGDAEKFKAKLEKKINSFIRERKFEEVTRRAWEVAHGRGVQKGSEVGANNPFALRNRQNNQQQSKVVSIEESHAKVAKVREQYGR